MYTKVAPYVTLITHTPEPERAIAAAARLCYADDYAYEVYQKIGGNTQKVIAIIMANGHESPLEHASFTFAIDGISRACSHQLVRHRLASPNQQSQRYVKAHSELSIVVPESIRNDYHASLTFDQTIETIQAAYTSLIDLGIPPEDARYLLPNATETHMIMTFNARELRHVFSLRCCNRAQDEIRNVAWQMLGLVRPIAPQIFANAGPSCVREGCHEGKMSCGHPYPKK